MKTIRVPRAFAEFRRSLLLLAVLLLLVLRIPAVAVNETEEQAPPTLPTGWENVHERLERDLALERAEAGDGAR